MKHKSSQVMEHLREIELQSPADIILQQVKESLRRVCSSWRPPPTRARPDRALRGGAGHIREALKRLEFLPDSSNSPQSGTIVAHPGMKALGNRPSNVLGLEKRDLRSLMETRAVLVSPSGPLGGDAGLAAEIADLEHVHDAYCEQVRSGGSGLEQNVAFHLKIAECARKSHAPFSDQVARAGYCDGFETARTTERRPVQNGVEGTCGGARWDCSRNPRAGSAMEEHMQLAQRQFEPHVR